MWAKTLPLNREGHCTWVRAKTGWPEGSTGQGFETGEGEKGCRQCLGSFVDDLSPL